MKNSQKGFVVPLVIAIIAVLVIGGGGVYLAVKQKEKVASTAETSIPSSTTNNQVNSENASTPTSLNTESSIVKSPTKATVDADVEKVKAIAEKIRVASLSGDKATLLKYSSKAINTAFSSFNAITYSTFIIDKVFKSGNVVVLESTVTTQNGAPDSQPMVFIMENGEWKFDLQATADYLKKKDSVGSSTNGYIDLIVTGIKVYPEHPIVNNPNVEIIVSVKNLGTKTSDKGVRASSELVEFTDAIPTQGGQLTPINPGQTVTFSYKPYSHNAFFNDSDVAGKKTLKIRLNEDKDILESNYSNNTFTQTVEMFSN